MKLLTWLNPLAWSVMLTVLGLYLCAFGVEAIYEIPLTADGIRLERPWALLLMSGAVLVLLARGYVLVRTAPRLRVSRGFDLALAQGGVRRWLRHSTTGLRVAAVTLLAIALAGPQSVHVRDRAELEGIDIVLTLDLSRSMQAADIEPNRFEATKAVVDDFILRRPNDRLGAVVFGREAYTLLPLTTDKEALRTMIKELMLGIIDGRGTAIGNAIGVSLNRLRGSEAESKVVILLTDGDSNSGNVSPDQAAEFARTMGVKIYTILMGETDQTRVQRGVDLFGRPLFDTGNYPVNPQLLEEMAKSTGGEYYQVRDRGGLERSFHQILNTLEKSTIEDAGRIYGELFPAFLWPALGLLLLELLLSVFVFRRWP